jgi:hypothetical protein
MLLRTRQLYYLIDCDRCPFLFIDAYSFYFEVAGRGVVHMQLLAEIALPKLFVVVNLYRLDRKLYIEVNLVSLRPCVLYLLKDLQLEFCDGHPRFKLLEHRIDALLRFNLTVRRSIHEEEFH